ncbi:APC family permease [Mycoplasmopsis felis]|uniref:APC family permease n=1 Tax=Mycoplasmopsis felis TaxID=33923 RepID=UPI002AF6A0CC|nr:APC family permease [Mycoplasmopsis felis]WQQ02589.1 APC family permease [Mycoplasmopsis felis]WQQ05127.1 APC family permease [Mycoplasmopsis felis]WQQ08547.1 APC family permease [Mycoplasmopsis felis]
MKNKLTEKQFFLYGLNYIVGFGFLATITSVISRGLWGMLIFSLTAFISFSVILAFARGSQEYSSELGGTYVYAKKASKNKWWVFFNGWNQFAQVPLFSATTILFFSNLLAEFDKGNQLIYQIVSLIFFLTLAVITTFGIKVSKMFILASAIIKWSTIILGVIFGVYLSLYTNNFSNNFLLVDKISVSVITTSVLNFIYSFGGAEGLAGIRAEVQTNRFKKILMLIFITVLSIYFTLYILLLGLDLSVFKGSLTFSILYNKILGITGLIIFAIGTLFNRISSTLSSNIYYARMIVPLAEDGFIPKTFAHKSKNGEYKNALILSTSFSFISMIIFTVIPIILGVKDQFSFILNAGNIVFLVQYFLTILSILIISLKHKHFKLPIWEIIVYIIALLLIAFITLSNLFPILVGEKFTIESLFLLPSYLGVMLVGYILWGIYYFVKKRKSKKTIIVKNT